MLSHRCYIARYREQLEQELKRWQLSYKRLQALVAARYVTVKALLLTTIVDEALDPDAMANSLRPESYYSPEVSAASNI